MQPVHFSSSPSKSSHTPCAVVSDLEPLFVHILFLAQMSLVWNPKCVCVCVFWLWSYDHGCNLCHTHTQQMFTHFICPKLNQNNTVFRVGGGGATCSCPSLLVVTLSCLLSCESFSSFGLDALANGLDGALEAGGCLQLQLVGHGVDFEPIQSAGSTEHGQGKGWDEVMIWSHMYILLQLHYRSPFRLYINSLHVLAHLSY